MNTVAPTLDRVTANVGQTITINHGTYTGLVQSYGYVWFEEGVEIVGETGQTYVVENPDVTITAEETAHNYIGDSGGTDTSNACETALGGNYLAEADFEDGQPDGWTNYNGNNGSSDWAYASSPAPLRGSFSYKLAAGNVALSSPAFAPQDEVWVFATVYGPDGTQVICLASGGGDNFMFFAPWYGTDLLYFSAEHGYIGDTGVPLAGNTLTYLWIHYVKGTGANAILEIYSSPTPTRPASPQYTKTNGAWTQQVDRVRFGNSGSGDTRIFDYIRISAEEIGSNPV